MKDTDLHIIEKPEWVSWDEIHDVLWKAHAENLEKGMIMTLPSLPGEQIREKIKAGRGKMFVALDDRKVVATAAVMVKNSNLWCGKGEYAYFCFASILPEYRGRGLYKQLYIYREREAINMGIRRILFDTHEHNRHTLAINEKNHFVPVRYFHVKNHDHYSIVMVKWLDGCPYPNYYCRLKFYQSKVRTLLRSKILNR